MQRTTHARRCAPALVAILLAAGPAQARPAHIDVKQEAALNRGLGQPPPGLDRSTARRAWAALRGACAGAQWERGAHLLNLGDIAEGDQRVVGASLVRRLCEVLAAQGQLGAGALDDTPLGPLVEDAPANFVVAATIALSKGDEAVWLRRTKDGASGAEVWVSSRKTVSLIPGWHRELVKKESAKPALPVINAGLDPLPAALQLGQPRLAAMQFRKLAERGAYAEAAQLLDLRAIPAAEQRDRGPALARRLSLILDRLHPGGFAHLSNDPLGAPERGIPDDEELVARADLPGAGKADLRLERLALAGGRAVWIFSGDTVEAIDGVYERIGYGWVGDVLPPLFFRVQFAGVQLWQWIGLLLGLLLALVFGYVAGYLARRVLLRVARATRWEWDDQVVAATRGPLIVLFFALALVVVSGFLALGAGPQAVLLRGCKLLFVIGVGWMLMRTVDVAGLILNEHFKNRGDELGLAMVPVARKIFKPIMFVLVLILALQNAGLNVGGLLAGLGIGGLALAMAAKNTVEHMLGGITIAFDRPFKVGDFIKVGDMIGTVEEVGLRSTRVRKLERTVVTVPNGQMVDAQVENFAKRDRVWLQYTIGVQYDTSVDQLRLIIDEMKRALLAHPKVWQESFRVRFAGFGASSLDIETFAYVETTDFNHFTAIREELFVQVAGIVARAGAQFAFPSRTVYNGKAAEPDAEQARLAGEAIAARIAAGEWTIPEIPEDQKDALRDRLRAASG